MIIEKLIDISTKFPIVFLTGPRQSGKTTLIKDTFPSLPYFNLESPSERAMIAGDPEGFLESNKGGVIIDEVQNYPDLFSFIQVYVDKQREVPGQFFLTGSQNFVINEKISQSLAGRVGILELLPLSYKEIPGDDNKILSFLFKGGYPELYGSSKLSPEEFFQNYVRTYLERDVRQVKNITDMNLFQLFVFLLAGRVGQVINYNSLGDDSGLSSTTIKGWLSVLEASYILYLVHPYHVNINKRMVKAPKIYFYDTGLLCSLLGIKNETDLRGHYAYGNIFENFIINEILKSQLHKGERSNIYFLRDSQGHEIDCLIPHSNHRQLCEIKSSATFNTNFVKNLEYFKTDGDEGMTIYQGDTLFKFKGNAIINCKEFINMINES